MIQVWSSCSNGQKGVHVETWRQEAVVEKTWHMIEKWTLLSSSANGRHCGSETARPRLREKAQGNLSQATPKHDKQLDCSASALFCDVLTLFRVITSDTALLNTSLPLFTDADSS
jgi:hypothetical protein